jgi:cell division protein FtsN
VIREIVLAALANASRPVQPATPKPKRTPRQLSPEQHQRLMRQEAADRAEALALARSRQAEAEARARAVTKANADTTRCPKCGRSYALVGRSHLCSPTEIA